MKNFIILPLTLCIILSSCASIFNGTKETITIKSDIKGTELYVDENKVGVDSATVVIPKKKLKSTILKAKKVGCSDKTTNIATSFDPTTILGLFIDLGLISILVVDGLVTGAVNEAAQNYVDLTPNCSNSH